MKALFALLLLSPAPQDPPPPLVKVLTRPLGMVPGYVLPLELRRETWLDVLVSHGQARGVDVFARGVAPLMTDGER